VTGHGQLSIMLPQDQRDGADTMNYNVKLLFLFTFVSTAARGVWAFVALTNYLKSLTGDVVDVGVSEGVQGGLQALAAIVAGYTGDKFRRDTVAKAAGVIGLIAVAVSLFALLVPDSLILPYANKLENTTDRIRFYVMTVALACWGVYQGVWNTATETIFADSVKAGDRSAFNIKKFQLLQLASVVGPVLAVIMFHFYGNTWYHVTLRDVFVTGVSLSVPGALLLFFFNDEKSLGVESEAVTSNPGSRASSVSVEAGHGERDGEGSSINRDGGTSINAVGNDRGDGDDVKAKEFCGMTVEHIPLIMIISDLLSGLASGMTIKFFPLYFARQVWLQPVQTQLIYVVLPFFMIVLSKLGQMVAKKIGRVVTSVGMAYIGSLALAGLWMLEVYAGWDCAACPYKGDTTRAQCLNVTGHYTNGTVQRDVCTFKRVTGLNGTLVNQCEPTNCLLGEHWYVVLALYFMSTAQHCCRPLKKGILMDFVPKKSRSRWNALDSVTRFGWSGSAVLGGYIIDKWGYGASFLATAITQAVSATILFVLLPILPDGDTELKVAQAKRSIVSSKDRLSSSDKRDTVPLLSQ